MALNTGIRISPEALRIPHAWLPPPGVLIELIWVGSFFFLKKKALSRLFSFQPSLRTITKDFSNM